MRRAMRVSVAVGLIAVAASTAGATCNADIAEFRWDGHAARFSVEIADAPAERSKGLMFRQGMSAGAGMLFVYDHPQDVAFWMKNTLIPLDMLFIAANGRVLAIHPKAVPGDLTPIPGPPETQMVLEINGGMAALLGLSPGAVMRHPSVAQGAALWTCDAP